MDFLKKKIFSTMTMDGNALQEKVLKNMTRVYTELIMEETGMENNTIQKNRIKYNI